MWLAFLFFKIRLSYSYYANYFHQQQGRRFQDRFCNASWSSCLRKCTNQNFKRSLPGDLISLASSKIIHTNTRIVFTKAVSVAKISFTSHTVTKWALPSSLANTGMLIQRAKSRAVLLYKGEDEDTFQSHCPLA